MVMALLQWHMVYKLGEVELYRPPMLALKHYNFIHNMGGHLVGILDGVYWRLENWLHKA